MKIIEKVAGVGHEKTASTGFQDLLNYVDESNRYWRSPEGRSEAKRRLSEKIAGMTIAGRAAARMFGRHALPEVKGATNILRSARKTLKKTTRPDLKSAAKWAAGAGAVGGAAGAYSLSKRKRKK